MTNQQQIVQNYVDAYNAFDVEKMIKDLHHEVEFENVSNGQTNTALKGIEKFQTQAREALKYFSQREQKITHWKIDNNKVVIDVDYRAVLAVLLPNGLKEGDVLELKGTSEFTFNDGKIIRIRDES